MLLDIIGGFAPNHTKGQALWTLTDADGILYAVKPALYAGIAHMSDRVRIAVEYSYHRRWYNRAKL